MTSWNHNNGKNGHKKTNASKRPGAPRIDVDRIYTQLHKALEQRARLQAEQDKLWSVIKAHHVNRSAEMERITANIGKSTHQINLLLNQLCQCRQAHRAMNLAYGHLSREISRCKAIIAKWQRLAYEVDHGKAGLINSRGVSHNDTTHAKSYYAQKQRQLAQLEKWRSYVSRYTVA